MVVSRDLADDEHQQEVSSLHHIRLGQDINMCLHCSQPHTVCLEFLFGVQSVCPTARNWQASHCIASIVFCLHTQVPISDTVFAAASTCPKLCCSLTMSHCVHILFIHFAQDCQACHSHCVSLVPNKHLLVSSSKLVITVLL